MRQFANPVGWFEIHVADMNRAARFYENVFDQKLVAMPSEDPSIQMMMFDGDTNARGITGALVKHPMKKPSSDGALVYFSCDDCAITEKSISQHKGQIYKSKFSIGVNGFISIVGDSEGNAIGLHSLK